eukprot:177878-Rhodomonas_salina.1
MPRRPPLPRLQTDLPHAIGWLRLRRWPSVLALRVRLLRWEAPLRPAPAAAPSPPRAALTPQAHPASSSCRAGLGPLPALSPRFSQPGDRHLLLSAPVLAVPLCRLPHLRWRGLRLQHRQSRRHERICLRPCVLLLHHPCTHWRWREGERLRRELQTAPLASPAVQLHAVELLLGNHA